MREERVKLRKAGRPPAGVKRGEKVRDYPQISVRLPIDVTMQLRALCSVTGITRWRLIVSAIQCYVRDLPPRDRRLVDGLASRLRRHSPRITRHK